VSCFNSFQKETSFIYIEPLIADYLNIVLAKPIKAAREV